MTHLLESCFFASLQTDDSGEQDAQLKEEEE
jgi:hypothetical protein